jgi:Cof subfamily protein (haloacid dehalogenase superfamily)
VSYRLLACDIDNTLVRFPDPPSARVREALRAADHAGRTICLVTGRAFRRARPIAEMLGLDTPIICNHGGSIRDPRTGATIHRHVLPEGLAHGIVAWLQGQEVQLLVFDGDTVYHDARADSVVPDFRIYTRGEESVYAADLLAALPEAVEIILSTSYDHDHLAAVYERAHARYGAVTRVLFSHPYGLDILPNSSKSQALSWLAAHLQIPQAQVMAVGDGANDADMLAWAGLGIALQDGDLEALSAADVIAPSFADDGLAWAVERYFLAGPELG